MNKRAVDLKTNIDNVEKSADVNLQNVRREQREVNAATGRKFEEVKRDATDIKNTAVKAKIEHNRLDNFA
jgi:hypothetical protein